jgi:hypothetical protein
MLTVQTGQCGLCLHYGEHHQESEELFRIRTTRQASELYTAECGHPLLTQVNLRVSATSGCDAFVAAETSKGYYGEREGRVVP